MRAPRPSGRHLVRVSVIALLAGLLHVVSAVPAAATAPRGSVDIFESPQPGQVRAAGWAFDPDHPTGPIEVHVYVGGHGVNLGPAVGYRPDVNHHYPGVGDNHGFDAVFDVPGTGPQPYTVFAIEHGAGSHTVLSQGTIHVADPNPVGNFEAVSSPAHRQFSVSGWAGDPNNTAATLGIHVYIGGTPGAPGAEMHVLATSVARPDVPRFAPKPGFSGTLTTAKTGRQVVHVYAVNHPGSPGTNTHLGSRTVTLLPETRITSAPRYATTTDVIRVEFSASEPNATFQCRWDEAPWAACPGSTTVSLTPGNHMVSVRATDAYGNTDPTPATWVVTVTEAVTPAPPPPPPGPSIVLRTVKRKSKLRIDVGPDSSQDNYRVVIQRKVDKLWRKVDRVRTRGDRDVVVVDLRRGKYRAVLPAGPHGGAVHSSAVRLKR